MAYRQPVSNRRRAVAIGLTVAVHLLIVWLLLNLSPTFVPLGKSGGSLATFDVAPPAPTVSRAQHQQQRQRTAAAPPPPRATASAPKPPIVIRDAKPSFDWMSAEEFAKTDISKLRPSTDAGAGTQRADTGNSKAPYGPGEGPGGRVMYAAEWYREPTDAELNPFLPPMPSGSWGVIGCQTVPDYRVDNCMTLGESPLGSRIATGMRRAAWQFRVIPPRVDGRPQVGAWVKIRIDFTARGVEITGTRR